MADRCAIHRRRVDAGRIQRIIGAVFFPACGIPVLIGCIVVQLMLMFLPARWFAITPKTDGKTDDKTDDKNSQQPSQLSVSQQTPDTLAESR